MLWQSREENETGLHGRLQCRGENNGTYLWHLQARALTALTSARGCGSQTFFSEFLQSSEERKDTGVLQQDLLVSSRRTVVTHSSTSGCAWAHRGAGPFSHSSFLYHKKKKHHSFLHHSLLCSSWGHFPARDKGQTAARHRLMALGPCHIWIPLIKMANFAPTILMVTLNTSYGF